MENEKIHKENKIIWRRKKEKNLERKIFIHIYAILLVLLFKEISLSPDSPVHPVSECWGGSAYYEQREICVSNIWASSQPCFWIQGEGVGWGLQNITFGNSLAFTII